jgi:hypothetical protein
MDIHTSTSSDIHEPQPAKSWREGEAWQSFTALRPVISWLLIGLMSVTTLYISFHDANAEQTNALKDLKDRQTAVENQIVAKGAARDKQIDTLRSDMVDKSLFNERTINMQKQLDTIADAQKEILNRLPLRPLP